MIQSEVHSIRYTIQRAMDTGKSVLSKNIAQCCEDLHSETIRLHQIKESDVKTLLGKKCHNVCQNSSILCEAKAIYELCAVRDGLYECSIFNMYELKELINFLCCN